MVGHKNARRNVAGSTLINTLSFEIRKYDMKFFVVPNHTPTELVSKIAEGHAELVLPSRLYLAMASTLP